MENSVKKVAITPQSWEKIVSYITKTPVPSPYVKDLLEVLGLINEVQWLDVIIKEDEQG